MEKETHGETPHFVASDAWRCDWNETQWDEYLDTILNRIVGLALRYQANRMIGQNNGHTAVSKWNLKREIKEYERERRGINERLKGQEVGH